MSEKRENKVIRKQILVPDSVYEDLKAFSKEVNMTMNDTVCFFLKSFLEKYRDVSGSEVKSCYVISFVSSEKTKNLLLQEFSNLGIKNLEIKREDI